MAAILNFQIFFKKHKLAPISLTVGDRGISSKFSIPWSVLATFHKNHFPTTFGGHLEFLRET